MRSLKKIKLLRGKRKAFIAKSLEMNAIGRFGKNMQRICLSYSFLTGILRIVRESIFSGLDNLMVNSVMDEELYALL